MATKQRFQHMTLGDTARLQNFFYDNSASDNQIDLVAKVEVYKVDPRQATNNNPRGLVRKATKVRRPNSSANQIVPYPSVSEPEYWESLVDLDADEWEIGDFVDRWFLISDPDADLANPIKVAPYSDQSAYAGLKPINIDHVTTSMAVGTGSKTFAVRSELAIAVSDSIRLYYDGSNYMVGTVTAYSGVSMTVNVTSIVGSGTYATWLLIKSDNVATPVVNFRVPFDQNRLPVPAGITTTSDVYSVAELTTDLANYVTAIINSTAAEGSSPSTTVRRYVLASTGETIVTDSKRASSADVAAFPASFLVTGTYYTAYGAIKDGATVVGYFKIAYDSGQGSNVLTVQPVSPLPSIYPTAASTVIPYVTGTDRIANTIDVTWNLDPGNDTTLSLLNYGLYEAVPSAISSASLVGLGAVVESDYVVLGDGSHVDSVNRGHLSLNSTDGGETWNGTAYSSGAAGSAITLTQGSFDSDTGFLLVSVTWSALPPRALKVDLHYIDQWNLEATYDSLVSNAWDDIVTRLGDSKVSIVEHKFTIHPSLFIASSRPIPVDYNFSVAQSDYYVNTKTWMRVDVKPVANLSPEAMRFHYATISAGSLRYEIHRISADAQASKRIVTGNADWHEEATGLIRIDTTLPPLNRSMDGFVVFFLDLPDGSMVRSGRIFFKVIDDIHQGARVTRLNQVF